MDENNIIDDVPTPIPDDVRSVVTTARETANILFDLAFVVESDNKKSVEAQSLGNELMAEYHRGCRDNAVKILVKALGKKQK